MISYKAINTYSNSNSGIYFLSLNSRTYSFSDSVRTNSFERKSFTSVLAFSKSKCSRCQELVCYMSSYSSFDVSFCGTYMRHLFTNVSDSSLLVNHLTLLVPLARHSSKRDSEMLACSLMRSNR